MKGRHNYNKNITSLCHKFETTTPTLCTFKYATPICAYNTFFHNIKTIKFIQNEDIKFPEKVHKLNIKTILPFSIAGP